jgi:Ca-activated chloride channel homolog
MSGFSIFSRVFSYSAISRGFLPVAAVLLLCAACPVKAQDSGMGFPSTGQFGMRVTGLDTSAFPWISMNVKFFDGQRVLRNTSQVNIAVRENGAQQQAQFSCTNKPFVVALVLDRSRSMSYYPNTSTRDPDSGKWNNAKKALHVFINQMTPIDAATLVSFAATVTVDQTLISDTTLLHDVLEGLTLAPNTALWKGIDKAIDILAPRTEKRAIIVLTDGEDNASWPTTSTGNITKAKTQGIRIFTVGLGDEVSRQFLTDVAVQTGGKFYSSATGDDLSDIYYDISQELAEGCTVSYTSTALCTDGTERRIDLESANGQEAASADTTYTAPRIVATAAFRISAPSIVPSGNEIRVPISVHPGFRIGQPLHFTATARYDNDILEYKGLQAGWHIGDSAISAVMQTGGIVTLRGELDSAPASDTALAELLFSARTAISPRIVKVSLEDLEFNQTCPFLTVGDERTIIIDGICEKLAVGAPRALRPNYPSPVNEKTRIPFVISRNEGIASKHVTLRIRNAFGEIVATAIEGDFASGEHHADWNASSFPSGSYSLELNVDGKIERRNVLVVH